MAAHDGTSSPAEAGGYVGEMATNSKGSRVGTGEIHAKPRTKHRHSVSQSGKV